MSLSDCLRFSRDALAGDTPSCGRSAFRHALSGSARCVLAALTGFLVIASARPFFPVTPHLSVNDAPRDRAFTPIRAPFVSFRCDLPHQSRNNLWRMHLQNFTGRPFRISSQTPSSGGLGDMFEAKLLESSSNSQPSATHKVAVVVIANVNFATVSPVSLSTHLKGIQIAGYS